MTQDIRWEYFDDVCLRESRIAREIEKAGLRAPDLVKLNTLLKRVADGTAIAGADIKYLGAEKLWEVRFRAKKRNFRLLYSPERNGRYVLVALHFLAKDQNRLPKHVFSTARERLRSWRERQLKE